MNGPPTGTTPSTAGSRRRHLHAVADTGTPTGPVDTATEATVPPNPAADVTPAPDQTAHSPAAGHLPVLGPDKEMPRAPGGGGISSTDATGGGLADRMAAQVAQSRAWLPPLDPAVFDCYLGELAISIEPYTEADPVAVLASLLAAAGVHLGPGPHLPIGMERHPLVVWPLLIGHTGSGRKGTAWGAAKHLLSAAVPEFVAANIHSGLSSGEGLAAVFATEGGKEGDGPAAGEHRKGGGRRARLLPDDDCRLMAYEPEWASVMARMRREGNTLSATLRAAWEGGNLSTLNVDARVARRGHVGILAHITPGEFKAKVSSTDLAGGTYNRFLPVAVAQSKFLHLPTPPDPDLIARLARELGERLRRAREFGPLALSEPARDAWAELYLEFATHDHDGHAAAQLAEFTGRAAAHCLRLAGLHAAVDGSTRVQPPHLGAAAALVRYSVASASTVLRPGRELAELAAFIAAAGDQGRTREAIRSQHFGRHKTSDQVTALLNQLTTAGHVTVQQRPPATGKGRPAQVYYANPSAKSAVAREPQETP